MCVQCTRNYVHSKRLGSPNEYPFFSMTLLQIYGPDSQEIVVRLSAGGGQYLCSQNRPYRQYGSPSFLFNG